MEQDNILEDMEMWSYIFSCFQIGDKFLRMERDTLPMQRARNVISSYVWNVLEKSRNTNTQESQS